MVIQLNPLLVCDLDEPDCQKAFNALKDAGFVPKVRNVKNYSEVDFHEPRLYAGQYTLSGSENIIAFINSNKR